MKPMAKEQLSKQDKIQVVIQVEQDKWITLHQYIRQSGINKLKKGANQ